MNAPSSEAAENLARVRARIERAASRAGRRAEEITLVAISKTHPANRIRELYEAGVRHFGENRVQEWEAKRAHLSDLNAAWHMVGHVQSNKAGKTVRLFDSVDSVDSVGLAERLDRARKDFNTEFTEGTEEGRKREKGTGRGKNTRLRVLIEVKLDSGETKSGVRGEELAPLVEAVLQLPHLELRGLMGVPPYFDDAEKARRYFRRLRELRDSIRAEAGKDLLPVLSMGMSHDFEVAIEEGATEIRVGTALFGERGKA
jgi:pyridoxal phosphate enzyme (YggS family)